MIEYQIVGGYGHECESRVREAIAEGWTPHGGLAVYIEPDMPGINFFQAMVRPAPPSATGGEGE